MEEHIACGNKRKRCSYLELLMQNIQTLKEEINEVQNRMDRRWALSGAEVTKQRDAIKSLEKEKTDIIWKMHTLKEMDLYCQGPKGISWKTYEALMQQIEGLEKEEKRLDNELSEMGTKYWRLQKTVPYTDMCRKKTLELKKRAFNNERRITEITQTLREQRDSCKELHTSVRSIFYVSFAFNKKQKFIRKLLTEGQYDLQKVMRAAITAYHTKSRENKRQLKLLCEKTKGVRREISAGIAEIKELMAKEQKFKELNVSELKKERVLKERYDPFSEKFRSLSYAEKKDRCEVILSRIFQESGEREVTYACRKYSENEIENKRIFERVEATTFETEKLFQEIHTLQTEIKQNSLQDDDNSKTQKTEIDEIEKATAKLRLESNEFEGHVDSADESIAYAKRLVRRMLVAAAPKHILDELHQAPLDCDLMLYLGKFEESVELLMKR